MKTTDNQKYLSLIKEFEKELNRPLFDKEKQLLEYILTKEKNSARLRK